MQTFLNIMNEMKTSLNEIKTTLNDVNTSLNEVKTSLNEVKTTLNDVNTSLNDAKMCNTIKLPAYWKMNCLEYGQHYVSGFDIITHIKSQSQEKSK